MYSHSKDGVSNTESFIYGKFSKTWYQIQVKKSGVTTTITKIDFVKSKLVQQGRLYENSSFVINRAKFFKILPKAKKLRDVENVMFLSFKSTLDNHLKTI